MVMATVVKAVTVRPTDGSVFDLPPPELPQLCEQELTCESVTYLLPMEQSSTVSHSGMLHS